MTLEYFKTRLYDLLNDNYDELEICDIETLDRKNVFIISSSDGTKFEISCEKLTDMGY